MEDNINWQLASNSQLKEECERLEKEFNETQEELKTYVSKIEEFNGTLTKLSKQYVDLKNILNKREGLFKQMLFYEKFQKSPLPLGVGVCQNNCSKSDNKSSLFFGFSSIVFISIVLSSLCKSSICLMF